MVTARSPAGPLLCGRRRASRRSLQPAARGSVNAGPSALSGLNSPSRYPLTPRGALSSFRGRALSAPSVKEASFSRRLESRVVQTPHMNNQALELLSLVGGRGGDPALKAWAASLAVGHRAELGRLNALLDRMGLPPTDVHAGTTCPAWSPPPTSAGPGPCGARPSTASSAGNSAPTWSSPPASPSPSPVAQPARRPDGSPRISPPPTPARWKDFGPRRVRCQAQPSGGQAAAPPVPAGIKRS